MFPKRDGPSPQDLIDALLGEDPYSSHEQGQGEQPGGQSGPDVVDADYEVIDDDQK